MRSVLIISVSLALTSLSACAGSQAGLKSREVGYRAGDTHLKGYLASPPGEQRRPAVLVVHEWWGHNDYARKRADMLAGLGYVALAVDMYGEGKQASHPADAGKFAGEVRKNMAEAEERFTAARQYLAALPNVDPDRIAAIGYCFGGGIVLEMARRGVDLAGVVSFHGSLKPAAPAEPGVVKAEVLVYNGAEDPMVKPEDIAAFEQEMESAGVKFELVNLPGAQHAFTNPAADEYGERFGLPLAYDAEADRVSWEGMAAFLQRILSR